MPAQQRSSLKTTGLAAIGISAVVTGVTMLVLLLSTPVQGNALQPGAVMAAGLREVQQEVSRFQPQPQPQTEQLQVGNDAATAVAAPLAQAGPQPANVNGRTVYAVPAVVSQNTTAVLQSIAPEAIMYVVHPLDGWGLSVSTTVGWFRCADMVSTGQYNGSQVEIENWTLLTQQERLEAQAACSLSTIGI